MELVQQFQLVEDHYNTALISNSIEIISPYLANDWILVQGEFGIISRERFLGAIERGDLLHLQMNKKVVHVKYQNDFAIVTSRGPNKGSLNSKPFDTEHWVTNIFKRDAGQWVCLLTHETPVVC